MNFFMYSKCGEGAGLLKRIQDEGNDCELYIREPDYQSVYNGILEKSNSPKDKETVIIFDSSGSGKIADQFRSNGFKVFGASRFHDKLESDREFGLDFMKFNGIEIPPTETFNSFSVGTDFIKNNKTKRFVFKPSGDLPSKLTYSSCDTEDLIQYMKFVEKYYSKDIDDFVLQEFIEGSIISTEYWVGKQGFIEPINHTIEVKKLMNDDLGPSTGCSGNIVWLGEENSPLSQELRKVEKQLVKNNYLGPIDLNCIINEKGIYGLEWTPRFGLDAMPTWLQLVTQDVGQIISDIVDGKSPKLRLKNSFSGGVRITIPPYPIELANAKVIQNTSPNKGIPIRDLEDENTYFYEIMRDDDFIVHSEGTGVIAVVSSEYGNPKDCFDFPYQLLEEAKIPDKQYRTDLGQVLPEMYSDVMEVIDNVWA